MPHSVISADENKNAPIASLMGTLASAVTILATAMGVKAFEMIAAGEFGQTVSMRNNRLESVPIIDAIKNYKLVNTDHFLIKTARPMGISFGD